MCARPTAPSTCCRRRSGRWSPLRKNSCQALRCVATTVSSRARPVRDGASRRDTTLADQPHWPSYRAKIRSQRPGCSTSIAKDQHHAHYDRAHEPARHRVRLRGVGAGRGVAACGAEYHQPWHRPARFPDAAHIVEAGRKALADGHHGYTPANGILPLREAVAADLHRRHGIEVSPDRVLVVPGGKVTMFFAIMMFGEAGTEIIYPNPGFPIYESVIRFSGATPVPMQLDESRGFSFSAEEVLGLITPRTRLHHRQQPRQPDRRRGAEGGTRSTRRRPRAPSATSRSCRTRSTARWSMAVPMPA